MLDTFSPIQLLQNALHWLTIAKNRERLGIRPESRPLDPPTSPNLKYASGRHDMTSCRPRMTHVKNDVLSLTD